MGTQVCNAPTQPFLLVEADVWVEVKDGNVSGRAMYGRHYSRYVYRDGRRPALFVGPGDKLVLITPCARALFAWRKFRDDSGQQGVNCAVFRNEGAGIASELIRAADALAFERWPGQRHYTFVDRSKIKASRQPGRCFLKAGWRYVKDAKGCRLRTKKRGLYILELSAEQGAR